MKSFLITSICFFSLQINLVAQEDITQTEEIDLLVELTTDINKIGVPENISMCLRSNPIVPKGELELSSIQKSPIGFHLTFQQFYNGIPIENALLKAHFNKFGELFHKQAHLSDSRPRNSLFKGANVLTNTKNGLIYANKKRTQNGTEIRSKSGEILYRNSGKLYLYDLNSRDTQANVKVFLVNPVNSAGVSYGPPFVDNADANSSYLSKELSWKKINLSLESDSFVLQNNLFRFSELSDPIQKTPKSKNDSFFFERSNPNFEFVNCYFHLSNYANYIQKLQFFNLLDTLVIDPRIEGDNSFFDINKRELQFGIGNVDDAEDGEVVIHEYAHSLSTKASPNTTSGVERLAMEEGNADYLTKSYSRSFTGSVNSYKVFSWDGHNEFWPGFSINSQKIYPNDLTASSNNNREIWSTPLMKIWEKIGKEKTDRLILSHLFFQMPNTKMPEMAKIILKLDTQFYDAEYSNIIWKAFFEQGILPEIPVVMPINIDNNPIFKNTYGFAFKQAPLEIIFPFPTEFSVSIFCTNGAKVAEFKSNSGQMLIRSTLPKGLYILQLDYGKIINKKIIIAR